jgi:hypothetical protein
MESERFETSTTDMRSRIALQNGAQLGEQPTKRGALLGSLQLDR